MLTEGKTLKESVLIDHKEVVETPLLAEAQEAEKQDVILRTVQMDVMDVPPQTSGQEVSTDQKEFKECESDREVTTMVVPELNLPEEEVIDFENYKKSLDQHIIVSRPRSFSDPSGSERYIPYNQTLESAFNAVNWVGERPELRSPELKPETPSEDQEPGTPRLTCSTLYSDVSEPGQSTFSTFVLPEQKINERKPMVFVGGVSASTTPLELVQEFKKQGFNVTVVPRIRYGVSFGFCPDLVLSSIEEVEKLLSLGRIWVKDRWIDIRPYIPKDEPSPSPPKAETFTANGSQYQEFRPQSVHLNEQIEFITHEVRTSQDLMTSNCTTPDDSQNTTPELGNCSPVNPGHFYSVNPPYFQMAPVFPLSPGQIHPNMMPQFFPNQVPPEFILPQMMQSPSPPSGEEQLTPTIQHPLEAQKPHVTGNFFKFVST